MAVFRLGEYVDNMTAIAGRLIGIRHKLLHPHPNASDNLFSVVNNKPTYIFSAGKQFSEPFFVACSHCIELSGVVIADLLEHQPTLPENNRYILRGGKPDLQPIVHINAIPLLTKTGTAR